MDKLTKAVLVRMAAEKDDATLCRVVRTVSPESVNMLRKMLAHESPEQIEARMVRRGAAKEWAAICKRVATHLSGAWVKRGKENEVP